MPRHRVSPLGAAVASAAVPGWGQLLAGRPRLGRALTGATLALLVAVSAAVAGEGVTGALSWLVEPDFLAVLVLADLAVAGVRIWATAHAWRAAGGRLASVVLATVVFFVVAPHAAVAYYGLETRSTLLAVFPESEPALPAATTTTAPPATTAPAKTTTEPYRTIVSPNPIPTTSTTTTLPAHPLGERLTVLLLGGDAGPGRSGLRTDTVIVATVDTGTGDVALFGLPRNMGGLSFSDGTPFPGLSRGMLNEIYQWGWRNPERFPGRDPGAEAVRDVASTLLGIPIDHYLLVDMVGFAEVVDVLGGVEVQVPRPVPAPLYDRASGGHTMITIPAGPQLLDGDHALAFARSRTGSNDYDRMRRQRCLLSALADQAQPLTLFRRLPDLLDAVEHNLTTDLPLSKVPFLIDLAGSFDEDRMVVIGFDRDYRSGRTPEGLWVPDVARIQATVHAVLSGEQARADLETAGSSCR